MGERLRWPDLIRGVCVLLVVAMHIYRGSYERWFPDIGLNATAWSTFISAAQPIRMPIFFVVSGFLAARAIFRPIRQVFRGRVAGILYLYFVWLAIYAVVCWAVGETFGAEPFTWMGYLTQIFWPDTALWYLYALVAYFLIAKFTARVPAPVLLMVSAAISIVGTVLLEGTAEYLARSLVFYLVGARYSDVVESFPRRFSWGAAAVAAVGYGAIGGAGILLGGAWQDILGFAAGLVGVPLCIALAKKVGNARIWRPFIRVGQSTLAIFVLHPVLILLWNTLVREWGALRELLVSSSVVAVLYVIVLTALATVAATGLRTLAGRIGMRWLFVLPEAPKRVRH